MIKKPNILIAGTGAIGGYFGAFLALNKNLNVCFLARGKTLKHFQKKPLVVKSTVHNDIEVNINVSDNVQEFNVKFDYVFICVKSQDTENLILELKKIVSNKTRFVTLQNGLYNYRVLKENFGEGKCFQALCKIGVEMDRRFVVQHTSLGFLTIGKIKGEAKKKIHELQNLLQTSGIKVNLSEDFLKEIWIKFSWNIIFNSLTALNSVTVDKLFATKKARLIVENFYNEVKAIAASEGIIFDDAAYKKIILDSVKLGKFKTSAYQDLRKKKPLEIKYFTSELMRIAQKNSASFRMTFLIDCEADYEYEDEYQEDYDED